MSFNTIPCILMRGGTSRGPYFLADDLPENESERDRALLTIMGSPDVRQIDGIGGATPLTSKVAIVSKSSRPGIDVDYLFAQVSIDKAVVDTAPSCGNMLSGIGAFAIEKGLVPGADGETRVMVFNVNTSSRIESIVQTPGGRVTYDGDASIDGVPGTAAPVVLNFMDVVGSKSGKLLPTGNAVEIMSNGLEVSCVDVAMPMMFVRATDVGLTGDEDRESLASNREMFELLEPVTA